MSRTGAFVYYGDSEYSESVVGLARGAHTFLAECCFPDDIPVPGHLILSDVARIAREVGVGRVVLTHIYRPTDALDLEQEVGKGFDGEVVVAEDGTKLTV